MRNQSTKLTFLAVLSLICLTASLVHAQKAPKYVFLFIGDGMATAQRMAADQYLKTQGKDGLLMNSFPVFGMTTTYQNDRFITDSAAAGTALATGVKTNGGYIGVTPDFTPVETLAEKAKKTGKKVGIVSSVTINHATPASFYAHQKSRNMYYEIGLDLTNSNFDFFGGGGPVDPDGKKSENPQGNLLDLAKNNGYTLATGKESIMNLAPGGGKVWAYSVVGEALPYSIDTTSEDVSLTDYTRKALELLDGPEGFFMMVEGGKIDWTCHANDAKTAILDTLEFDKAIKVAYDFYQAHPDETLIVVTGDHETGGLTLGFAGTKYDSYFNVLDQQKISYDLFSNKIFKEYKDSSQGKPNFEDVVPLLKEYFGLEVSGEGNLVLKDFELRALKTAFIQTLSGVKVNSDTADYLLYGGYDPFTVQITHILNQKAGIAWTSYSHTGVPLPTSAIGIGAESFNGFYDNTDLSQKLMSIMELNFQEIALVQ